MRNHSYYSSNGPAMPKGTFKKGDYVRLKNSYQYIGYVVKIDRAFDDCHCVYVYWGSSILLETNRLHNHNDWRNLIKMTEKEAVLFRLRGGSSK